MSIENTNYMCSFSGADCTVSIDGIVFDTICGIEVSKRHNLPQEDFCQMIKQLNGATLPSVKNLDGIAVIGSVVTLCGELDIPDGATIVLHLSNEYGHKMQKVLSDCYLIKRTCGISVEIPALSEQLVVAVGTVGKIEKI